MWSRLTASASLAIALVACESKVKPPPAAPSAVLFDKHVDPGDLVPADLDVVARVDLERMRGALGPLATGDLAKKALEGRGDAMSERLLACADVLWLGLRFVDLEAGDHVAIIEGKRCEVMADTSDWTRKKSANADLTIFDRVSQAPRSGNARVVLIGDRAVMLASPAELASLDRVLRDGPDAQRGEPKAEGLLSLDMRGHALPPDLERRFPAIGRILAGIERMRATIEFGDTGLDLAAEVRARTPEDAERTFKFLSALRSNAEGESARLLLASIGIERVGSAVRIHWTVPAKVVLGLLGDGPQHPDADAPKTTKEP